MITIVQDTIGRQAKKKILKRRLNLVAGNLARYSCVLEKPSDMVQINEYNHLVSVLGSIQYEKYCDKEEVKQKNK